METTSFEVSKKLQEIGFKTDTYLWWMEKSFINLPTHELQRYNQIYEFYGDDVPAYDLETILEALPKTIKIRGSRSSEAYLRLGVSEAFKDRRWVIYYENISEQDHAENEFRASGESLADTAARLLIILVEKGIVN